MRVAIGFVVVVLLSGCLESTSAPDPVPPDADALALLDALATFPEWRLTTTHGDVRILLYPDWTPQTVASIVRATERGDLEGTDVYRVVDDFVMQGGNEDQSDTYAYTSGEGVPLELAEGLDFGTGAVGLARTLRDDGTSHYFVAEKPALHLSRATDPEDVVADPSATSGQRAAYTVAFGQYALFGQVFEGMDVVRAIMNEPVDANDRPTTPVDLLDVQVLDAPADADLLNLIPDVHAEAAVGGYVGELEHSRLLVVGHPGVVRFTTDSAGQAPCALDAFSIEGPSGEWMVPWVANTVDACTFEAPLTFTDAGVHTLRADGFEVQLRVLPWSDAYAPFTGTAMNDA